MSESTTIKRPLTSAGGANIDPQPQAGFYPGADCEPFGEGAGSPHTKTGPLPANLAPASGGVPCSGVVSGANGDLTAPSGPLDPIGNEGRRSA